MEVFWLHPNKPSPTDCGCRASERLETSDRLPVPLHPANCTLPSTPSPSHTTSHVQVWRYGSTSRPRQTFDPVDVDHHTVAYKSARHSVEVRVGFCSPSNRRLNKSCNWITSLVASFHNMMTISLDHVTSYCTNDQRISSSTKLR